MQGEQDESEVRQRDLRIVVIDDNAADRLLATRALLQAFPDARIEGASDQAGLERCLQERPDAVVTDYSLRWTTGIEVIDTVRAQWPGVPVIMFTNTGSEEIAARALRHGVADYVIKRSGEIARLTHAVRNAVSQAELSARVELLLRQEREARLQAEEATRLREEFLATLSHELRTPLQAILGWIALMRRGVLGPTELQHAVEVVERNVRAQARLIEDLLDLSRIATGKFAIESGSTPLHSLVQEVIDELRPLADAKSIVLRNGGSYDGEVHADRARLQQVLRILLDNAVKFSPSGSEVTVRSQPVDSTVEITVVDRGQGLDPAFVPLLFERFSQADASRTRRSGGMGIGLSIARHIVELHGGAIAAHSEGPGQGTTFRVRLPLPAGEAKPPTRDVAGHPPSLAGLRILLVEDEPDAREVIRKALEFAGAHVLCADSAPAARKLLSAHRPDALVSDIGLPDEDGMSLVSSIRRMAPPLRDTPALALTAYARAEDREGALAAGFDAHVHKPVDPEALMHALAALVERPHRDVGGREPAAGSAAG